MIIVSNLASPPLENLATQISLVQVFFSVIPPKSTAPSPRTPYSIIPGQYSIECDATP